MIRLSPPPPRYDPQHQTKVQAEIERALRNLAQLNAQVSFGRIDTVQLYIDGVPYSPGTGIVETISAAPGSNLSVDSTDPANPILDFDYDPAFGTVNMTTLVVSGTLLLPAGSIGRADLASGAAKSVIGRAGNTVGAVADIAASAARQVLACNSTNTGVGFRAFEQADLPNSAAKSVIGRSANTAGAVADIAGTTARHFLAVNSANTAIGFRAIDAADLPGGNWVTGSNGEVNQTSATTISSSGVWTATSLSISLPAAGTYLINAVVPARLAASNAASFTTNIYARLFNVTAAAAIAESYTVCANAVVNSVTTYSAGMISNIITVAGATTVRVEVFRGSGPTYTVSEMAYGGLTYVPRINYIRLA